MTEFSLGLLVIGVLIISDPDRLQMIVDRVQEVIAWLAE